MDCLSQAVACGDGVDKVPRFRSGLCHMAFGDDAVSGVSTGPVLLDQLGRPGSRAKESPIAQTLVSLAGAAGLSPNSTSILSN